MNGSNSNTSGAGQAKFRFKPQGENDRAPKWLLEEMERLGFVVIETKVEGNVLIQPNEPEDKTKVWWKSDVNGVPQGSPLVWNAERGKWEPIAQNTASPYTPPERRYGTFFVPAGKSQQTPVFTSMKTEKYFVWLTPSLYKDGAFQTPPDSFPSHFGYVLSARSESSFQAHFYGIPEGGMTYEWMIEVIPNAP